MRRHVAPHRRPLRRYLIFILIMGAVAATLYLARAPLLRAFAGWWVVDEAPLKSDAIVVLGGDSIKATRVRRAVELYQQGWAPRIVLAGGLIRTYLSEGSLMKKDAEAFGAPDSALEVVESDAGSTIEECAVITRYAAERNFHRVLIVTSDFHSRRAQAVYQPAMQNRGVEAIMISAPQFLMGSGRWWGNREALKQMFFESIKFPETWWEQHRNSA
jgi:uncharacterized SAM-binding protein YcdF (DUF218 family)